MEITWIKKWPAGNVPLSRGKNKMTKKKNDRAERKIRTKNTKTPDNCRPTRVKAEIYKKKSKNSSISVN